MKPAVILVTGANGFIGSALTRRLAAEPGCRVLAAVRGADRRITPASESVIVGDISSDTLWDRALQNVNTVVHAAARVHVLRDTAVDPLSEFRAVNVRGTLHLARQAAVAGVTRFVYVSSIKVNGETTTGRAPFRADDAPAPVDPYGVSKSEAEHGLRSISDATGLQVVIVRPPLVYGPGVGGNFRQMMQWICRGVPLPLGAIHNRRSLVAQDNLVDLIVACIDHPAVANQTLLVSDDEDLSTPQLLRRLGQALSRPVQLIPVPASLLRMGAALVGRRDVVRRLCDSLQIDLSKTRRLLGWHPVATVDDSLERTAKEFLRETRD